MRFRLLYSGRLLGASRSDTRASLKHQIRMEFHPQLKRLWATHPGLRLLAQDQARQWASLHPEVAPRIVSLEHTFDVRQLANDQELERWGLQAVAETWARCGRKFIPLVTEEMCLECAIEVLFLRPEAPGRVVQGADLDNRLKTLFDGLRIPANMQEAGGPPQDGEDSPIYCLLEDDSLISEIHVATDNLLLLPKEKESTPNDVFLVIDVKLQAPIHGPWALTFG